MRLQKWEIFPYNVSMDTPDTLASSTPQAVLQQAMRVMRPLVLWLMRSGIGYAAFSATMKPLFLECAREELLRNQGKVSDSALSLLSGLHRKDVRALSDAAEECGLHQPKASPAQQVIARWLADGLPQWLDIGGSVGSFEALAKSVSGDFHPRAILSELERLGVVATTPGRVELLRQAYIPDPASEQAGTLMASGVADHLAAAVHNLSAQSPRHYLEQAVFADGLSADSVRQLERLANRIWSDVLAAMVGAAVPMCENDEPAGGDQRLRLGMYCYSTVMDPPANTPIEPEEYPS